MPNNLAILRAKRNFSQSQLADLVGVTKLTLGRWERGEAVPRKYYQEKLCGVLECNAEDLGLGSVEETLSLVEYLPSSISDPSIPLAPVIPLIGREHELGRIKEQLCQQESHVVLTALNGIPGVGKTSLAITLVHDPDIRAYFCDGVLWAALGPTPNLSGLLGRWAGLLGLSESQFAKLDEERKRQTLRTAIGTRSMLLVLDDVWKLEDALALGVGGPHCASLLTTRFPAVAAQMATHEAMYISELDEEQSIKLLYSLSPEVVCREETKARELVRAVGGLPLALTLIGKFLRKQAYSLPVRRISAALDRLSVVDERFRISEPHVQSEAHPSIPGSTPISLSSIIEISERFLTEAARQTLYALSIFPPKPESFSEEAALAVAACTSHELDELLDAGLLEVQGETRYRLHQIIADYARINQDLSTAETVTLRLLAYIQAYVEQHAKEYELLEQEITLILYALDKAVTSETFQERLVPFVCASAPFLLMRGYYQELQHFLNRAYTQALVSQEPADIATVLLFLGDVRQKLADLTGARESYVRGQEIAEQLGDATLLGMLLHSVARITWILGDYQEAETLLQEGLTFARATEQQFLIHSMCRSLAALYSDRADFAQGEVYAREGLAIARRLEDRQAIIAMLINLGCCLGSVPVPEKEALYQEAVLIAREIKSEEQLALALTNLGDFYTESDLPRAEACLREALQIARRIGHHEQISVSLAALTVTLRLLGHLDEAEICVQEALALARESARTRFVCIALAETGNLALARGNGEAALAAFTEMLHLCPQGDPEVQAMGSYGMARAHEMLGQWEQAQSAGDDALALVRQHPSMQHSERVKAWYTHFVQRLADPTSGRCICGNSLEQAKGAGRTRRYCSNKCRQLAQRKRKASLAPTAIND